MRPETNPRQPGQTILLYPGAFQSVHNYGGYDGIEIWKMPIPGNRLPPADCYIGHSAGCSFILSRLVAPGNAKFIFVNPLVRRRSRLALAWAWIGYLFGEGIAWKKIVPVSLWWHNIRLLNKLIDVDVMAVIAKIPAGNLVVIRGKGDRWIYDEASEALLKSRGIRCIEADAGHDWNDNIRQIVERVR